METAPLINIIAHHTLELILDFLKLEPSVEQQEDVLVITDHFTQYAQAYPTRNQTTAMTA